MPAPVNIVLAAIGASGVITALQGVQGALTGLAAAGIGAGAALGGIRQTLSGGVGFNAQLETARLGVAAVLKQFDDTGHFKSFDEAIGESAKAIELLKQSAVTSPASFSSLVQAFQGTVGPMTSAGIALRDQVALIVNMSQALSGLGIQEAQILQETRALITGNINADAAAAKILGITSADIAQARAKGQLYQFLADKIKAFAEAGERGSRSLNTLKSNLGDAYEQRAAAATEDLTESLKKFYSQLTELVNSPQFQQFVSVFARTARGAAELGTSLSGALQHVNGAVAGNAGEALGLSIATIASVGFAQKLGPKLVGMFGEGAAAFATQLAAKLPIAIIPILGFLALRFVKNTIDDLAAARVTKARTLEASSGAALEAADAIDSEKARYEAAAKLLNLQREIATARAQEQSGYGTNIEALRIYDQQLTAIHTALQRLNSSWAQHQIAINQATSAAERLAKAEAAAAAWLKSDDATKLRGEVAAGVISRTDPAERLANARSFLAIMERTIALAKAEAAAGRDTAVNKKILLQTTASREAVLQDIAALETRIAQLTRNQLEARQVEIQRKLSALDANFAATDADKWARRRELLVQSVAAAQAYLDKVTAIRDANPHDAQAQANVVSAQQGLASAQGALAGVGADPDSFFQQMQSGIAQLRQSWGTMAQDMAATFTGALDAGRTATGDFLYNVLSGAESLRQAWGGAMLAVGQQFLRLTTDMVAKLIWKSTVERLLIRLGVIEHVTGETTKTTATLTGGAIRLGVTLKEALADVYHGAVAAFKALAQIPYVGPILGAAAMAAALAGGIALVSKIGGHEAGGLVRGGQQLSWLNESGEEFVWSAPAVKNLGADRLTAMHEAARRGNLAAFTTAAPAAAASPSPGGAAAEPMPLDIGITPLDMHSAIQQWAESRRGRAYLVDLQRGIARRVG